MSYKLDGRDTGPCQPSETIALWTIHLVDNWKHGIYALYMVQIHMGSMRRTNQSTKYFVITSWDVFYATIGSLFQKTYSIILLLWFHYGLSQIESFPWHIQCRIISEFQSSSPNFAIMKEYSWDSTWSTFIYELINRCMCHIRFT